MWPRICIFKIYLYFYLLYVGACLPVYLPCGGWELSLSHLQAQPELLTTDPFLQSFTYFQLSGCVRLRVGMCTGV